MGIVIQFPKTKQDRTCNHCRWVLPIIRTYARPFRTPSVDVASVILSAIGVQVDCPCGKTTWDFGVVISPERFRHVEE